MNSRKVAALLLLVPVLLTPACGGQGDPDREELERLRDESEFYVMDNEAESALGDALAIASRNSGKPLGQDAFDFAQDLMLDWYRVALRGFYADRVPEPPRDVDADDVDPFRRLAGFIEVVPAGYSADAVEQEMEKGLAARADDYLRQMERSLENRREWVSELETNGQTGLNFLGMATETTYEEYGATLAYLRELAAESGAADELLSGLDMSIAAATLADYTPPSLRTRYENGVLTTTYTAEAVTAGSQNADELAAAIAAARGVFPAGEKGEATGEEAGD